MNKKIWLSSPNMGGKEIEYVTEAFETNWIAPLGPNVDGFESDMSTYLDEANIAALSSGTAAIHLALIMLGVQPGDDVICQSFTFSASANPIRYQFANPIFIDSEPDSWNMDPQLLEQAIVNGIEKGKKPKAVIVVHLYGQAAKMDEIVSICKKYNVPLIEDAAEALGSEYKGQKLGTFGDFGILSFNGNKIITTSGGGMLVAKDENYIRRAKFLATQARDEAPHYQHSHIGYNYRMSNILAGVGRGQMRVIGERIEQKRGIFQKYFDVFKDIDGINFQSEIDNSYSNKWLTAIVIDPVKLKLSREDIRKELLKHNIESRPLWKPMHLQPVFSAYKSYITGVSENLFNDGLCLPSDTNMTNEEQNKIIKIVLNLIK